VHAPDQLPPAWEAKTSPWNRSSQRHTYGNMLHLLDKDYEKLRMPKKLKSDDGIVNTRAAWKQQRFAISFT